LKINNKVDYHKELWKDVPIKKSKVPKKVDLGKLPKFKCVGCGKIIKGTIIENGEGYWCKKCHDKHTMLRINKCLKYKKCQKK